MKGYAALLIYALLWPLSAAALTEGVSSQCPDGRYVVDTGTPDCPTNVTGATAGDALADTTTNIQATLDQTGGTDYWCVYPSGNADPDFDQLVAGTDGTDSACTDSGNGSAASTAFTDSVTGLTAATEYKTAVANLSASGKRSQVSVSNAFTTTGGVAPGGDDLTNAGTFVGCGVGASDSNNGTSHAQRLASLPSSLATGQNVYLETDCVWEDTRWVISANGTSSDLIEIDTYCIDTSDSNKPKGWTDGGTGCGEKAELNGTWDDCADTDPITCDVGSYNGLQAGSSPVPSGIFSGLLDLGDNRQYVHIRNLKIHDSAGRGIDMKAAQNVVIEGLDIHRVAFPGFMSERGAKYNVALNNVVDRAGDCEAAEDTSRLPGDFVAQSNCGASAQPSCFKFATISPNSYSLLAGNIVKNCPGEGFGSSRSSHLWIEANHAYDTGVSVYLEHNENTYVIRNHVAGSGNGAAINQSGFSQSAEGTAANLGGTGVSNALWAFNIAVGTDFGFGLRNIGSENVTLGNDIWALFWHNSSIRATAGGGDNILFGASGGYSAVTADMEFKNNVTWADSAANACRRDSSTGTFDYNGWDGVTPSDAQCVGANDVNSFLTWPHTSSEYENITEAQATSTWTLADYKPTGGSENAGQVLSVPAWATTDLANSEWDFAKQYDGNGYFIWGDAGCTVEISAASLLTGADCQGLDGTPDMGAVQ